MRTLWRATIHLFWQYPILWLPVALADLTAYCLKQLQAWMTQAVIHSLVAGHSVLSNTPEPVSTFPAAWTVVFGISNFLVEFANLCLYTAAMIAISALIPVLIAQTKISARQILSAVGQLRVQVLLFSLQLFGMLVVAMFLDLMLATYLPQFRLFSMLSTINASRAGGLALIALLFAAVAWLMASAALTLLRPPQSSSNDAIGRRQARKVATISVLVSVAIYFLMTVVAPSFVSLLKTAFGMQFFWAIASAASAIPYIPLFIALYLIANPDSSLATIRETTEAPSPPESPVDSTSA